MRRIHAMAGSLLAFTLITTACDEDAPGRDATDGESADAGADTETSGASGDADTGGAGSSDGNGQGEGDPDSVPEPEACTIDRALGDIGGDAAILAESCTETGDDVSCVYDVHIGALGGLDGQLTFEDTTEGSNYELWIAHPDPAVYAVVVNADGQADVTENLIGSREQLAELLGLDPLDLEVQQAQVDLLALMQLANETIPQPAKTWCERACAAAQVVYCIGVSGAAGACCLESGGLCCGAGAGLAAGACAIDARCEERCDSSNL